MFLREIKAIQLALRLLTAGMLSASVWSQDGTLSFHNRSLTGPTPGTTYNAAINGFCPGAKAQLYLVTGTGASALYTPLFPRQTFRPYPNHQFFVGPVAVTVDGHPPGTTGLNFVVRVWTDAETYEEAIGTIGSFWGESELITVHLPLGGTTTSGEVYLPPDLGGPSGLQSFTILAGPPPGQIIFHNRDLTDGEGGTYSVPFNITDPETARAQLYLVTGSGTSAFYTPLHPLQTFGPPPNHQFFAAPQIVNVYCQPPGTAGLSFVVRFWEKASSYEAALTTPGAVYGQSDVFTVEAPLGGFTYYNENVYPAPDLGGPRGWKWSPSLGTFFNFLSISVEDVQFRFGVFVSFGLASGRYVLDASPDLESWSPLVTNQNSGQYSFTVPLTPESLNARFFRMRTP